MRLFIALALPPEIRAELAAVQGRLCSAGHPVRWANPAGMHLTLQFLGEAAAALVEPLLAALAGIPAAAFRLHLDGLGAFPGAQQPRVVWAGLAGDLGALEALQRAVLAATAPLGFQPEKRPFKAHLTLGRSREEARPDQLRALGTALAAAAPPAPLAWAVQRPVLYQSTLTPGGPVYRALEAGNPPDR